MALRRRRRSSVERIKELVREALEQQPSGSSRTIGCEPSNGLGAVIIDARPEDGQALLWIRGGPDDPRPALLHAMVPLDDRPIEMLPQGNRSIEADEEAQRAAADWLATRRRTWRAIQAPAGAEQGDGPETYGA